MSAAALLARLIATGCRVTLRPDGRISLRPVPPLDLLAEARQHRDELALLCAGTAVTVTTLPVAEAPPAPVPSYMPWPARPSLRGDPPPPVVDADASRTLAILELAGTEPSLQPDGHLTLTHPERVTASLRAEARRHRADIAAVLAYRALQEKLWSAEPLPPKTFAQEE
jgi:hypothetical protein